MSKTEQKRLSVIVPKETADAILAVSQIHNCTVSDIINDLLAQFVQQNYEIIEQYRTFQTNVQKKFPSILAQDSKKLGRDDR